MTVGAVVLRPAPGDARTVAALVAAGIETIALPLFAVGPVAWTPPDPTRHDAVLFTSANAARHGGAGLAALRHLPAIAVGAATAAAVRAAGFTVAIVGDGDVTDALAGSDYRRPLHLAGRDHRAAVADTVVVYASEALPARAELAALVRERVVLLHSARAAARFAELVGTDRGAVAVAAISDAVREAAGDGWAWCVVAPQPTDAALVAAIAQRLTGAPAQRLTGAPAQRLTGAPVPGISDE